MRTVFQVILLGMAMLLAYSHMTKPSGEIDLFPNKQKAPLFQRITGLELLSNTSNDEDASEDSNTTGNIEEMVIEVRPINEGQSENDEKPRMSSTFTVEAKNYRKSKIPIESRWPRKQLKTSSPVRYAMPNTTLLDNKVTKSVTLGGQVIKHYQTDGIQTKHGTRQSMRKFNKISTVSETSDTRTSQSSNAVMATKLKASKGKPKTVKKSRPDSLPPEGFLEIKCVPSVFSKNKRLLNYMIKIVHEEQTPVLNDGTGCLLEKHINRKSWPHNNYQINKL